LDLGAVDFIAKPHPVFSSHIEDIRDQILEKLKMASRIPVKRLASDGIENQHSHQAEKTHHKISKQRTKRSRCINVVSIGVSAGGPKALKEIIPTLPANIPASFLIVQHMPPGFTGALAERLNHLSQVEVKEARTGDPISNGTVLIARGGHHLTVTHDGNGFAADLNWNCRTARFKPSIDVMMASAAEHFREKTIGVIMTGMCSDGVKGVRAIKEKQGQIIAQDKETSAVYGMNRLAVQAGVVDRVVPLHRIVPTIMEMLG